MKNVKINFDKTREFCELLFTKLGFAADEAAIITDTLLEADLYGVESHGIQRLVRYQTGIDDGTMDIHAVPETVFETPVSAVIDGKGGMGQLISHKAMKLAIEKAKKSGMAIITVRNSNHYGIAGYYAKMACDEGLIGVCMTNTNPIMVPTHSKKALLGSNPIAFAMPADPVPFYFDAATTVVPLGKLEVYNKKQKPMPEGWCLDENGVVSTDAGLVKNNINKHLGGGILPVGGNTEATGSHKGYGFSMIVELLTGILSCGETSNHHQKRDGEGARICHVFIAVNPAFFGDADEIKARLSSFLDELRNAPLAEGETRVYTHGEKEVEAAAERRMNGIEASAGTLKEIHAIAQKYGIDTTYYFGDMEALIAEALKD